MLTQIVPQLTHEFGIFGEALHQNLACAIQHSFGVGESGFDIEEFFSFNIRSQFGVIEQRISQRLNPCFPGDLCFRAAFLFIRQI